MASSSTNRRISPSVTDSDYYHLIRLRTSLTDIAERHLRPKRQLAIFDFGCGDKPYRSLFDFADKYVGADISGNPFADIIVDSDGRVPCEDASFDVVLSSQVLEHVPDVDLYLDEARRVLKTNGLMILSTHGWWTHHPYPHDYWRWTREGLTKILNANGFEIVEVQWNIGMLAYSCQLRVQCWKGMLRDKGVLASFVLRCVSAVYQQLMKIADRITPDHIGRDNAAIYIMVARKAATT
jgi:SAM-dependent methyltransferase